jgi:hypothetical protein
VLSSPFAGDCGAGTRSSRYNPCQVAPGLERGDGASPIPPTKLVTIPSRVETCSAMSFLPSLQALMARIPRPWRSVGLVALGLALGLAPSLLRDKHAAAPEQLVGTVIWSNEDARLVVFEADGDPREDREYRVAAVYWTDAAGQPHNRGYPTCLAGQAGDPVRTDHRRVVIEAIRVTDSAADRSQLAVGVRCLS